MEKIFSGTSLDIVSDYINNALSNETVVLQGDFYGCLNLHPKNDIQITIKGENATISGVETLDTACKEYKENVYSIQLERDLSLERIWINGENYIMARYPNIVRNSSKQSYCTLDEATEKIKSSSQSSRFFIRGLHSKEWGGNSYKVHKELPSKLVLEWVGNNNRGKALKPDSVILENSLEELDSPNEFYYDNATGILYFFSTEKLSNIHLEYASRQTVLIIENSTGKITFENILFTKTDNSMYKGKWERYLRSDWAFNSESAIKIKNSKNIEFKNCLFSDLGNTAIQILDDSEKIYIEGCDFTNSYSNGVLIRGDKSSTYCSSSWENDNHITTMENYDKKGCKNNLYPKNIKIDNCLFKNLGLQDLQCSAVCISLAENVTVRNSTICYMPRAGINICENAFGGHKIIGNDIYECVRETGDHGPFNSWGRDRFWSLKKFNTTGKYGKVKRKFALYDMLEPNEIAENRVVGSRGFGIDLDDGSSNYRIHHNFCVGVGIKLREGFKRTVYNNILVNAPLDYHCPFYKNDDVIKNNVIYNDVPLALVLKNYGSNTYFENNYSLWETKTHDKNFIYNNSFTIQDIIKGNFSLKNIEAIPQNFGKKGLSEHQITIDKKPIAYTEVKTCFFVASTVDESIRTATGAPDYRGIFIKKCSPLSSLYGKGIRQGDVIISINNNKPQLNTFKDDIKNIRTATIIRNQKNITI